MASAMLRRSMSFFLIWLVPATALAQPPKVVIPEPLKVMPRALDSFKLPPGTIVVVADSKDAFKNVDAVVLSPDEYRKLLENIEQLRKQINPEKPEIPGICRLDVSIGSDVVKTRATYEFRTTAARTSIILGFRQANAVSAKLDDGKSVALQVGSDGYSAIIDSPGTHTLVIEFESALLVRGGAKSERRFAMQLPGAAITLLEKLELPAGTGLVRLRPVLPAGLSPIQVREFSAATVQKLSSERPVALGPVDGIEFSWDVPAVHKTSELLLATEGQVSVRISDDGSDIEAILNMRSLRGPVLEWKLTTPAGAEVMLESDRAEAGTTVAAQNPEKSQWLIRVREPGVEELKVKVHVRVSRGTEPKAIGPFAVQGALPQRGAISVYAPDNVRPHFTKVRSDVRREEIGADDAAGPDAVFSYGNSAVKADALAAPYFVLNLETLRGEVRSQLSHLLTWSDRGWRITTTIKATPIRMEFDRLEVELPPGLQDVQSATESVTEIVPAASGPENRWQIRLDKPRRQETTIQLEGVYPALMTAKAAKLLLPRVVGASDREGQVRVVAPIGQTVRGSVFEWGKDRISDIAKALEDAAPVGQSVAVYATGLRNPARVDLTWRPVETELQVHSVADITLDDLVAVVRQQVTVAPGANARKLFWKSLPGLSPSGLRAEGASLALVEDSWQISLTGGRDTFTLIYSIPLKPVDDSMQGRKTDIGLVWPADATSCETKIRFWSRPGGRVWHPELSGGPWTKLPIEIVQDRPSLPTFVLQGTGVFLPLTVNLTEAVRLKQASALIDRVLIQATENGGRLDYRVRFLIREATSSSLQFELPGPPSALNLDARLDGKRVDQLIVRDDQGKTAAAQTGHIVEVPLTAGSGPRILEFRYQASTGRTGTNWEYLLTPLQLIGERVGTIRWQISLPHDDVLMTSDSRAQIEQRWVWKKILFAPAPRYSGEQLEQWFNSGVARNESDSQEPQSWDASAVLTSTTLEPIRIVSVPRSVWLMTCSLTVLVLGLLLIFIRRFRWLFWIAVIAIAVGVGAASLLWPERTMTALIGSALGWIILAIVILVQWYLQQRYERRVVFMPGFTRRPASTVRPASASKIKRREPSTVDVPPAG